MYKYDEYYKEEIESQKHLWVRILATLKEICSLLAGKAQSYEKDIHAIHNGMMIFIILIWM